MKTAITANVKDSIGAIAIIACIFTSAVAGIASSQHANVNAAPATIYKMDVIEVTAPRMKVERMETIVVTASRLDNAMIAANGNVNAAF
jgi:hypothetical protein